MAESPTQRPFVSLDEALRIASGETVRVCESGCGCRYGTTDPDHKDCACDGPCAMSDPADWGCNAALGGCGGDCPTCPSGGGVTAIPDDARTLASKAIFERLQLYPNDPAWNGSLGWGATTQELADAALAAALPALRQHIADEEIRPYIAPSPRTDHAKGWNDALGHVAARLAVGRAV